MTHALCSLQDITCLVVKCCSERPTQLSVQFGLLRRDAILHDVLDELAVVESSPLFTSLFRFPGTHLFDILQTLKFHPQGLTRNVMHAAVRYEKHAIAKARARTTCSF